MRHRLIQAVLIAAALLLPVALPAVPAAASTLVSAQNVSCTPSGTVDVNTPVSCTMVLYECSGLGGGCTQVAVNQPIGWASWTNGLSSPVTQFLSPPPTTTSATGHVIVQLTDTATSGGGVIETRPAISVYPIMMLDGIAIDGVWTNIALPVQFAAPSPPPPPPTLEPTPTPQPTATPHLTLQISTPASAPPTVGTAVPVTAQLVETPGDTPLAGKPVTFSAGAGTVRPTSGMTDAQGKATTSVTGSRPGTITVTAESMGLTASGTVQFAAAPTPPVVTHHHHLKRHHVTTQPVRHHSGLPWWWLLLAAVLLLLGGGTVILVVTRRRRAAKRQADQGAGAAD